jgi:DNA-binding PucR family transcriptional regulator
VKALRNRAEPRTVEDGYLPALLRWAGGDPSDAELASMRAVVRRSGCGRVVSLDRRRHVLLLRGGSGRARATVAEVERAIQAGRPAAGVDTVIGRRAARHYALACLLDRLDARAARTFAADQLAALEEHDREHGTSLLRVLELALDHPDRNAAARAAYMHRNTFRRRLRAALTLIDADLDSPEERLALHLAVKMRTRIRPVS